MSLFLRNSFLLDKCCEKQISETHPPKKKHRLVLKTDGHMGGLGHHIDRYVYSFSLQRRLRSKFIPPKPAINTFRMSRRYIVFPVNGYMPSTMTNKKSTCVFELRVSVWRCCFERMWNRLLTLRRLTSYIYGAPILDVSRSHTTTQHSR
jgi:hypothetical protein